MSLRDIIASFDIDGGPAAKALKALHHDISGAKTSLADLGHKFAGFAKLAAEAFAIHEIGSFIKEQIEAGSVINDTAEKLGVGTDELQAFQFAAKLAGVGSEEAAKGLQFLSKNVGEAIGGNKEAIETFTKLGIHTKNTDGTVRELGDLIPEVADAFQKMGSSQERTAQAMKIFGKSGASLIPLLKGGSAEVQKLYERFQKLGGGFNKDFIEKADKAGDEIDVFKFSLRGLSSEFVVALLPTLTDWVGKLANGVGYVRKLTHETNIVTAVLWSLAAVAGVLAVEWAVLNFEFIAVAGLVLIAEDLFTLFTGGKSLTGQLIDKLWGVGSAAKGVAAVKDAAASLVEVFKAAWPIVAGVGELLYALFVAALPAMKFFYKNAFEGTGRWLMMFIGGLKTALDLTAQLFQGLGQGVNNLGDFLDNDALKALGTHLAKGGVNIEAALAPAATKLNAPPEVKVPGYLNAPAGLDPTELGGDFRTARRRDTGARAGAPKEQKITNHTKVEVNVNGGKTNEETGRVVADHVRRVYENDLSSGKRAMATGGED